ncbi:hypothetical protein ACIRVF_00765 [Kitasatospora sp. NPDC101157]|uniref:hypothetical protein n=1 Tax=Kitasatospora sp. NPDC101157 TaxID=3364098 RepID=UPI00380AF4B2
MITARGWLRAATALLSAAAVVIPAAAPAPAAGRLAPNDYGNCGVENGYVYADHTPVNGLLAEGGCLAPGGRVLNEDGWTADLVYQPDGNLVLYRSDGQPLWASNTAGQLAFRASMQDDGNFVLYQPDGSPYWATGTNRCRASYEINQVHVQSDWNVVIYRYERGTDNHQAIWDIRGTAHC